MQLPCLEEPSSALFHDEWWDNVAWSARIYTKGQIDRAGRALVNLPLDAPERDEHVAIVDNWRACHAYPLQVIKMTLLRRAKKIDHQALIAQRLKRRPSIEVKLRDNPSMQLSQMQDIGGCRAVLSNVTQVRSLIDKYKQFHAKSPKNRSDWDGSDDFDYILRPKPDGYRSTHLIFRFYSDSDDRRVYNGQRIEIQIRTKLQHSWATAVETAQLFTGQALKSRVKNANDDWLRFFSLTGSVFALREKCQHVPETPDNKADIIRELQEIVERTNIMESLRGWNDLIHFVDLKRIPDAYFYLLSLDVHTRKLDVEIFTKDQTVKAQQAYDKAEKDTERNQDTSVVLVSVNDIDALNKAYPNYYVDTKGFISAIEREGIKDRV